MRLGLVIALAGCMHAGGAGGSGGFRVSYAEQPAKVGRHYQVKPSADCTHDDGSEARWATTGATVTSGELPPGVAIEDGALNGTPTKPGTYRAQITVTGVTCASKPMPDQHVDVTITVR
ncbi:MAG: putative Ig domain-containing protein [Acidobacteriota bacterium]